jgi:hypothetical protein
MAELEVVVIERSISNICGWLANINVSICQYQVLARIKKPMQVHRFFEQPKGG